MASNCPHVAQRNISDWLRLSERVPIAYPVSAKRRRLTSWAMELISTIVLVGGRAVAMPWYLSHFLPILQDPHPQLEILVNLYVLVNFTARGIA